MTARSTIDRPAAKQSGRDIVITRVFDAPRELVWRAWTEPGFLRRWWGPKVFTTPVSMIDLRVGGAYLHCMRSPEGKDYWSTGVYREIVPNQRIVATDSFADEKGGVVPASYYGMPGKWPLELIVNVTFGTHAKGTRMTLRHTGFPSVKMRDLTAAGWSESFDKLAEALRTKGEVTAIEARPGKPEIIITRTFDAPRDLVFKAYTDPDLIARWWGPKRFTISVDMMDARPGGLWRFINRDAGGNEFAFHGVYHEISAPGRIVGTFEFEGTPGHVSLETLMLEENGGRTKATSRSVFQTVGDRDEMLKADREEGVDETMDRLAGLLAELKAERKAA